MDCARKVYQWEKYHETVSKLLSEVDDIFKTQCFYNVYSGEYHEIKYQPDEETPYLKKFAELIKPVYDFTKQHLDELNKQWSKECDKKSNLEKAFEAWKRNLCPKIMKNFPRYFNSNDPFNSYSTYDEVASFLTEKFISLEDTKNAVHLWEISQATRTCSHKQDKEL